MARKPIETNHPDPPVNRVERAIRLLAEEVFLQGTNFPQRVWVVENKQVLWELVVIAPINRIKPLIHSADRLRFQSKG